MPKSDYANQIKATEDVVKDLAFQISSFLVRAMNTPSYGKIAHKGITTLLNQAIKIVPAMLAEDALLYPDEDSLAHDEEEEELEEINYYHGKNDGRFSPVNSKGAPTKDSTYSTRFSKGKARAKTPAGTKKRMMISPKVLKNCGRSNKTNTEPKGDYRCYKDKPVKEDNELKEHFRRFL